ncbi:MAG: hypothetical protein KDC74_11665 [Flavobacteriaceae bacterium]|jgi:hypothetical protein|nr:hypothetical protein [Flavobacteriaceae bacterium]
MKKIFTKSIMLIVNVIYMLPLTLLLLFTNQNREIDKLFNEFKTSMEEI